MGIRTRHIILNSLVILELRGFGAYWFVFNVAPQLFLGRNLEVDRLHALVHDLTYQDASLRLQKVEGEGIRGMIRKNRLILVSA
ncbi:hypothetical protein DBR46_26945 [Pseudomonas sp. KBW05]|nr:hypothetical protein DBR46_26945 [Pseudomonas sp. KBW05]